jgi:hypothetical protein
LDRGGKLLLFTQTDNPADPVTLVFNKVSPGRRDEYSQFKENLDAGARAYSEFKDRALRAFRGMFRHTPKDFSPICQSVRKVARHPAFRAGAKKTIILLSDLMQHAADYSSYDPKAARRLPGSCAADLSGVAVIFLVVERDQPVQKRAVQAFQTWVVESGGRVISVNWL